MSKTQSTQISHLDRIKQACRKDSGKGRLPILLPLAALAVAAIPLGIIHETDKTNTSNEYAPVLNEYTSALSAASTTSTTAVESSDAQKLSQDLAALTSLGYSDASVELAPDAIQAMGDSDSYRYQALMPGGEVAAYADSQLIGTVIEFDADPVGSVTAPCLNVPTSMLENRQVAVTGGAKVVGRNGANGSSSLCVATGSNKVQATLLAISPLGGFGQR